MAAAAEARENLLRLQSAASREKASLAAEVSAAQKEVARARRDKAMHTLAHRRMQRHASADNTLDVWKTKANTLLQTLDLRARLVQAHRAAPTSGTGAMTRLESFQQEVHHAWSAEKTAQISQEAEILGSSLSHAQGSRGTQKDVRTFMLLAQLVEDQAQLREALSRQL